MVSVTTDEICTQEPNNPTHEAVERNNSEDPRLIERARAVGDSMNLHKMVWLKLSLTESKDTAETKGK